MSTISIYAYLKKRTDRPHLLPEVLLGYELDNLMLHGHFLHLWPGDVFRNFLV